jgi:hypothetical protein
LRCTPQRYAVMAFLMKHSSHPTAAEIFEAVNRVDPRCSRATTYNNLRDLVQAVWFVKWPSRGAPRDSMRKASGITTSSATAAVLLKTWIGTKFLRLPHVPWASGSFANANPFFGGSARNVLRGAPPVQCRRYVNTRLKALDIRRFGQ